MPRWRQRWPTPSRESAWKPTWQSNVTPSSSHLTAPVVASRPTIDTSDTSHRVTSPEAAGSAPKLSTNVFVGSSKWAA